MARKAALVTVLSLVPAEEGRMRVWIGLGVLQLQLVAQLVVRPYRTALQNRLDTLSLTAQFVSLFVGQAIGLEIVAPSDEGAAPARPGDADEGEDEGGYVRGQPVWPSGGTRPPGSAMMREHSTSSAPPAPSPSPPRGSCARSGRARASRSRICRSRSRA